MNAEFDTNALFDTMIGAELMKNDKYLFKCVKYVQTETGVSLMKALEIVAKIGMILAERQANEE